MKTTSLLISGVLASSALALQATTTRYFDGQEGACGCGHGSNFGWQTGISPGIYTAAGSQALFDQGGSGWCGSGCGICYQLTSTGHSPQGAGGASGQSIIVMVTNLCPNNGNKQWCPNVGGTNDYGYEYHFDIMAQGEVFGDNPVVDFKQVSCPSAAVSDYGQCQCPQGSKGVSSGGGNPAPPPSNPGGGGGGGGSGQAQRWGQCGGTGWNGPTSCVSGTSCHYSNQWYSQCL